MSTFYNQQVFTLSIMEYGFRNGYQYSQKRAIRSAGLKLFLMLFSVIDPIMIMTVASLKFLFCTGCRTLSCL